MVEATAAVEELPSSSLPNGTAEPASSIAEVSAEDRGKASEWRLKGNDEFKRTLPK